MCVCMTTCEVQRLREPQQGDVIPASVPVKAFMGDDVAHRVGGVKERVQRIHDPSVHRPVRRAGGPTGTKKRD